MSENKLRSQNISLISFKYFRHEIKHNLINFKNLPTEIFIF